MTCNFNATISTSLFLQRRQRSRSVIVVLFFICVVLWLSARTHTHTYYKPSLREEICKNLHETTSFQARSTRTCGGIHQRIFFVCIHTPSHAHMNACTCVCVCVRACACACMDVIPCECMYLVAAADYHT
jgi:hypothetical protein